jgi:hypothetical protein
MDKPTGLRLICTQHICQEKPRRAGTNPAHHLCAAGLLGEPNRQRAARSFARKKWAIIFPEK